MPRLFSTIAGDMGLSGEALVKILGQNCIGNTMVVWRRMLKKSLQS